MKLQRTANDMLMTSYFPVTLVLVLITVGSAYFAVVSSTPLLFGATLIAGGLAGVMIYYLRRNSHQYSAELTDSELIFYENAVDEHYQIDFMNIPDKKEQHFKWSDICNITMLRVVKSDDSPEPVNTRYDWTLSLKTGKKQHIITVAVDDPDEFVAACRKKITSVGND